MAQIKTEKEYQAAMGRIDELLPLTWKDGTPEDTPENIELALLSDLVAEYEDIHYPIKKPSLIDVIKLRMYEMGLTQAAVAQLLGISAPRMSEIMHGKIEPSLSLARTISQKLNIDADIVLGV
jgi:HTH-type transcriptional regulator/antitoxin HigA